MNVDGQTQPLLLLQLSDTHIGGNWDGVDPAASLRAVVDAVQRLPDQPDAVLVTGDLTHDGTPEQTEAASRLLAELKVPVYVLPGNHDDRDLLRSHFDLAGSGGAPVQYSVELGPLRLVVLDTTRPGEVQGELDAERLAWLDAELATARERITLLAMHHPPIPTGIGAWDRINLCVEDRNALAAVLQRHPQVRRVVAGHVHQTITDDLAGRTVLSIPSTCVQASLKFSPTEITLAAGPPAFAVHALVDGDLVSYVRVLG